MGFNPWDSRYVCICGCHVTTGTKIITAILLAAVALIIISFAIIYPMPEVIFSGIILFLICVFIFLIPYYGIKKCNPFWLIPLLVLLSLSILYVFIATIVVIFSFGNNIKLPEYWPIQNMNDGNLIAVFIYYVVRGMAIIALLLWFLLIVSRCYQYLTEKKKAHTLPIY
uniref:NADH dehydrogenase subunit 6 n=1 Tax=Panagrolaimus sp. PS1159 TaxID=55785 RepID=A0AC35GSC7_9BILA